MHCILWRIDPLLGNDRETDSKTTVLGRQQILTKQQLSYKNRGTVGNSVFCGPLGEQRCSKHVSAAMNQHAIIEELLETVFSVVRAASNGPVNTSLQP
jgi:hypothetical protein